MPDSATGPDERGNASDAAHRAVIGLARDRGADFITRPNFPGSRFTVHDLEPVTGARAAHDIELRTRHIARDYIRRAPRGRA